jgi:uncharacterized protein YqgC (DUF456 family)
MTVTQIIGLIVALSVMLCGSVGSMVPGIPGTPLVLAAAVGHRLCFGATGPNNWVLAVLVLLTLISVGLDYVASVVGAKKLGATWRGILGAIIGGFVGLFFSVPGIILGPFLGALLLEFAGGRDLKPAAKAGMGALLGLIVGAAGKFAICVAMMLLFAANVIYRSI